VAALAIVPQASTLPGLPPLVVVEDERVADDRALAVEMEGIHLADVEAAPSLQALEMRRDPARWSRMSTVPPGRGSTGSACRFEDEC
jgi:hypothetical protein